MKRLLYFVLAALMALAVSCGKGDKTEEKVIKYGVDGVTPLPEAVDLGLPSGLKWASFNLGASKPGEFGDYYAWGETETHYSSLNPLTWKDGMGAGYGWLNYKFGKDNEGPFSKYNETFLQATLETGPNGDDVASKALGGNWRMPTDNDWLELKNNCTWTRKTMTDGYPCNGYLFAGNGNSIFLPAAGRFSSVEYTFVGENGYYWSSSFYPDELGHNRCFSLKSDDLPFFYMPWCKGLTIRPVCVE